MMNRTQSVGMTVATVLMSAMLAAQAPGTPQQPPSSPPQQPASAAPQQKPDTPRSDTMAGKMTLSGCIEKAAPAAGASSAESFVFTNVTSGSASAAPGSTVGTAGTPSSSKAATAYRLDAEAAKLTPHVGHRVEIVGTVTPVAAAGAAASPSEASARPTAALKVESIKMVSQTCTK